MQLISKKFIAVLKVENVLTNPALSRQMVTKQEAMMMVVTMMGRRSLTASMSVLKRFGPRVS